MNEILIVSKVIYLALQQILWKLPSGMARGAPVFTSTKTQSVSALDQDFAICFADEFIFA